MNFARGSTVKATFPKSRSKAKDLSNKQRPVAQTARLCVVEAYRYLKEGELLGAILGGRCAAGVAVL